jgi:C4-type Zn-finger protein
MRDKNNIVVMKINVEIPESPYECPKCEIPLEFHYEKTLAFLPIRIEHYICPKCEYRKEVRYDESKTV